MKRLLKLLLGEYALYQVWQTAPAPVLPLPDDVIVRPVEQADLLVNDVPELRSSAWYLGAQSCAFGVFENGQMQALACCWWGQRYATRHSWPLPDGAAKLVHIVTLPRARGKGYAPLLIQHAERALRAQQKTPLLARIWHSNVPSLQAFRRAGWRPIGWLLQINPLRRPKPWRLLRRL